MGMHKFVYLCCSNLPLAMRYFLNLSYKGTNYHGWQLQRNAPSVQGEVEKALSAILRTPTGVVGAGRTDTGVHALHYTAHFDAAEPIPDANSFLYHANSFLPTDISLHSLRPVHSDAHARFDAYEREYTYIMVRGKDPFRRETSWQYYAGLDVAAMNEAAAWLLQFDDFTTFAKLNSGNKTNICHVTHAQWVEEGNEARFCIRANRFLRNMVRAITGTLVEVGRGKISPEEFRNLVAARDLSLSGSSAPAQGLFLSNIKYPDNIFTT